MAMVSVQEAETNLSALILRAVDGEDVLIVRGKEHKVRLVPVEAVKSRRTPGRFKGMFTVDPAAFAPLTDEELKDWGL